MKINFCKIVLLVVATAISCNLLKGQCEVVLKNTAPQYNEIIEHLERNQTNSTDGQILVGIIVHPTMIRPIPPRSSSTYIFRFSSLFMNISELENITFHETAMPNCNIRVTSNQLSCLQATRTIDGPASRLTQPFSFIMISPSELYTLLKISTKIRFSPIILKPEKFIRSTPNHSENTFYNSMKIEGDGNLVYGDSDTNYPLFTIPSLCPPYWPPDVLYTITKYIQHYSKDFTFDQKQMDKIWIAYQNWLETKK